MLWWNCLWSTSDRPSFESNACPVTDLGPHDFFPSQACGPIQRCKAAKRQSRECCRSALWVNPAARSKGCKAAKRQSRECRSACEARARPGCLLSVATPASLVVPSRLLLSCTPGSRRCQGAKGKEPWWRRWHWEGEREKKERDDESRGEDQVWVGVASGFRNSHSGRRRAQA
jgi:hypothetical protein